MSSPQSTAARRQSLRPVSYAEHDGSSSDEARPTCTSTRRQSLRVQAACYEENGGSDSSDDDEMKVSRVVKAPPNVVKATPRCETPHALPAPPHQQLVPVHLRAHTDPRRCVDVMIVVGEASCDGSCPPKHLSPGEARHHLNLPLTGNGQRREEWAIGSPAHTPAFHRPVTDQTEIYMGTRYGFIGCHVHPCGVWRVACGGSGQHGCVASRALRHVQAHGRADNRGEAGARPWVRW